MGHYSRLATMATMLIVFCMHWQGKRESEQQPSVNQLVGAIWAGDLITAHSILAKGIELNSRDRYGTTPLVESIPSNQAELVKELITNGANPNFPAGDGTTPLMRAAWYCHLELARFLLDHGARLEARDRDGETALMDAALTCRGGHMVRLLLGAGAAVNARGKTGETALMMASANGDLEAVKALVAAGADLNATDDDGETAFTLAQAFRYMLEKKAHQRVSAYLRRVSKQASRQQGSPR